MKTGDLVRIWDRDFRHSYGLAVVLNTIDNGTTGYELLREGKVEYFDHYWTFEVLCEAK
tara:strand:- start:561 stop:737 length:177 start_codon:yes stop_codon:yes gene_type:complete